VFGFINDHSLKYYDRNPFIESAVSPYINFKNGIIKINDNDFNFIKRTEKEENYFKELHPVNCFNFNYNKTDIEKVNYNNIQEHAPAFYHYVKNIIPTRLQGDNDEIIRTIKFVCQTILYVMNPIKKKPYFFAFYGDEHTAKSSLIKLIEAFISEDFIVARSVSEMENNRFATSDLWNAKILVDEDMDEGTLLPAGFLKKNSASQTVTIERKHENPQKGVKISVAMFFVSNFKLRATGLEGLKRRAIIIKFENKFTDATADPFLIDKIIGIKSHGIESGKFKNEKFDERSSIMSLVMNEWSSSKDRNYTIEKPKWIEESTSELLSEMTTVGEFTNFAIDKDTNHIISNEVYTQSEWYDFYNNWCKDEGRRPKGKSKFIEELKRDSSNYTFKRTSYKSGLFLNKSNEEINIDEIPF